MHILCILVDPIFLIERGTDNIRSGTYSDDRRRANPYHPVQDVPILQPLHPPYSITTRAISSA